MSQLFIIPNNIDFQNVITERPVCLRSVVGHRSLIFTTLPVSLTEPRLFTSPCDRVLHGGSWEQKLPQKKVTLSAFKPASCKKKKKMHLTSQMSRKISRNVSFSMRFQQLLISTDLIDRLESKWDLHNTELLKI